MRKKYTYKLLSFAVVCILMLQSQVSFAQWALDVVGTVKKEETKKRMEGATITIKRNGSTWKTLNPPANGRFEAALEPDAIYIIEFSKYGHVTKRIQLSTKNVPPEDAKYGFEFPLEINLFEQIDGLDVSILDKPIGKVEFDPETGYMDYDVAYTKSIQKELDRLKKELADKVKNEEQNRLANQKTYDAAIASGDKAYNSGKWAEAKPFYEKAAKIFSDETYPEFQLGDISDKLAELEMANKKYNSAIAKADAALKVREYDKAISSYEYASGLKEDEKYPKDKIKEVKTILSNAKKVDKEYNEAIAEADQFVLGRDYDAAKEKFNEALKLKDYEQYPKDKLAEIEKILAEQAAKEKEYTDAIKDADAAFVAKEYDKAIAAYQKAAGLKPAETYPQGRIEESKRLKNELKQLEERYNKFIADGDLAFTSKKYADSKSNFEQALALKKDEKYPKDKLAEIKILMDAAAQLDSQYAKFIKEGDQSLSAKDFETAKAAYVKASELKVAEQYPKDKLAEIDDLLAAIAKEEAEKKAKEAQYLALISEGDNLLGAKKYEAAKAKYNEALAVKSAEQYPKDKITEIDGLLTAIAKEEAEKKAKEAKYLALIGEGDNLFGAKNYEAAKTKFTEALALKTEEKYPANKITEIDDLLAALAKEEAEKKAKEAQYLALIGEGDNLLGAKKYEEAKAKYNEALAIKSIEQYPKDKIIEIDDLLAVIAKEEAEKKAKEAQYLALISEGDNLFGAKKYEEAKAKYKDALAVKSAEKYPTDKLKEIENILAELAKKKAKEEADKLAGAERDAKYNETIAAADKSLTAKAYETAKIKYNEALGIKSEEQYPADKLKEIENILAELAKKKAEEEAAKLAGAERDAKYNQAIAAADKSLAAKTYETAKIKYNEALGIKSEEKYPKDKLNEIELALAEIAKKKAEENAIKLAGAAKDAKYTEAITLADNAFGYENYSQAKVKYNEALAIKPDEKYPKDKLKEVEEALAALAKKSEEDALAAESERKKREYFNALIKEADGELLAKKYTEATAKYNEALVVIPGEKYPADKIKEIADLLAKIKSDKANASLAKAELDKKFNELIVKADKNFGTKNYKNAKSDYQLAQNLKPSENYPVKQIAEIDRILAEIAAKEKEITLSANAEKQKEADYNAFVTEADQNLVDKHYKKAITNYKGALGIKPNEAYPKNKIDEINKILAEIALKKQDNATALLNEQKKRKAYQKLIYAADRAFKLEEYTNAKMNYNKALDMFSNEKYPKDRLGMIAQILKKQSEPKEIVVSKGSFSGGRATINRDKEKEIEERMALLLGKNVVKKDQKLQQKKEAYNKQEEIRISGGIARTAKAKEELSSKEDGVKTIKERGNKFHKLNDETLKSTKELLNKVEKERIKKGDDSRTSNKAEIDGIVKNKNEKERAFTKRAEDMAVNFDDYKEALLKEEKIRITNSIDRTAKNEEELEELKEGIAEMKKINSEKYMTNDRALNSYKKELHQKETETIKKGDERRLENQQLNDRYVQQIKKEYDEQTKKYYADLVDVNAFKEGVAKFEEENQKEADNNRMAANKEIVDAMKKLGTTGNSYEKRYADFKAQLEEEKTLNNTFISDLQLIEQKQIAKASENLSDYYRGEKRLSEDGELAKKYPQGITEETRETGNSIIIKRTKVTEKHVDVYERVFYTWGSSYFYKNGVSITQNLWDKESIE